MISIFPFPNFRLEHLLIEADAFAHQFEGRPIGPGAPDTTVLSVPARSPEESSVPRAVRARVARPEAQRDGHLGSESSPTEAGDDDSSSGFDPNNDQPEKRARHSRRQYSRPQVRPPWIREVLERPPPDQPAPPRPQPQPQPQRRLPVVNIVWSSNQVDGGPLMMRIRVFMVLRRRPEAEFDRADAMRRATYLSTQVRGRLEENPEEGGNRGFEGGGGRFEEWVSVTSQTEVAIGFDIQARPSLSLAFPLPAGRPVIAALIFGSLHRPTRLLSRRTASPTTSETSANASPRRTSPFTPSAWSTPSANVDMGLRSARPIPARTRVPPPRP